MPRQSEIFESGQPCPCRTSTHRAHLMLRCGTRSRGQNWAKTGQTGQNCPSRRADLADKTVSPSPARRHTHGHFYACSQSRELKREPGAPKTGQKRDVQERNMNMSEEIVVVSTFARCCRTLSVRNVLVFSVDSMLEELFVRVKEKVSSLIVYEYYTTMKTAFVTCLAPTVKWENRSSSHDPPLTNSRLVILT
jgi:hypothetical protein